MAPMLHSQQQQSGSFQFGAPAVGSQPVLGLQGVRLLLFTNTLPV